MNVPGPSGGMRPGIILLREGTDTSQGIPQLISNINACQAVADAIRTTLGPSGRDKLVSNTNNNGGVTISNDGATLMKLLDIVHPAAKTLVDISMSQDAVVGDGTTSVVLLASEILSFMKKYIEDGIHPQIIIYYIQLAKRWSMKHIQRVAIPFGDDAQVVAAAAGRNIRNNRRRYDMLLKTASTALNSKLIANHIDLFAPMVVEAVCRIHEGVADADGSTSSNISSRSSTTLDSMINTNISIKKIPGGDVRSSFIVNDGIAFQKTFSYAGYEQMKKQFHNPKILLLNVELELKSEKENAELRISDVKEYQNFVSAEWNIIYDKLNKCIQCGANIVLSKLPIGDVATQYFLDHGLYCAGRVSDLDLKRIAYATNAKIQTTTRQLVVDDNNKNNNNMDNSILGTCELFEERQVGDLRFEIFEHCPTKLTSTIILRGGTEQFIAESERSIHDAIMIVHRSLLSNSIVAGGGAIEMSIRQQLQTKALSTIQGKGQFIVSAYAKALEVIPRQLCENAGFDPTDIMSALRTKHAITTTTTTSASGNNQDEKKTPDNDDDDDDLAAAAASSSTATSTTTTTTCWYGVDLMDGGICDTYQKGIWEPRDNKMNAFQAATEAACVILSIDETIIAPRSQQDPNNNNNMGGNHNYNKPMSNMMGNAMATAQQGGAARTGHLGPGVRYMKGRGGG